MLASSVVSLLLSTESWWENKTSDVREKGQHTAMPKIFHKFMLQTIGLVCSNFQIMYIIE